MSDDPYQEIVDRADDIERRLKEISDNHNNSLTSSDRGNIMESMYELGQVKGIAQELRRLDDSEYSMEINDNGN